MKQQQENKKIEIILTPSQQDVYDKLLKFVEGEDRVFVLKGYAGTGKTTLMRELIEYFSKEKVSYRLLASTGRAAKILSNITGQSTSTVHSLIYKYTDFNQDLEKVVQQREEAKVDKTGQLYLTFEVTSIDREDDDNQYVYIIDESSMISDIGDNTINQAIFGSGRLLNDLLAYDPMGKFIFVGDTSQLPPIRLEYSPALDVSYFKNEFDINAHSGELTQIMRQSSDNNIIVASHNVREILSDFQYVKWGKFPFKNNKDIILHKSVDSLMESYLSIIKDRGYNDATLICRSNNTCNKQSNLIRTNLGFEKPFEVGDLLLVTQNNLISGLMNGDMVIVKQISDVVEQRANLTFIKVEVEELFTKKSYSQLLIENIIYSGDVNIKQTEQKELFIDFFMRMKRKGIRQKDTKFNTLMKQDPYLNALRCVFGYALTCHKSQGGEWDEVFIDIPRNFTLNATPATYQWMYTAITRAKSKVHLVNDFYIE